MRRRPGLVVLLGALAIMLAGCVSIPTGGGVGTQAISDQPDANDVIVLASGPEKGMTPSEIITGFLRAGRDPRSSYLVAREFLADSLRTKWKPNAGTVVSNPAFVPSALGGDNYAVPLDVSGQVDQSGIYTPQEASDRDLEFHLAKDSAGQWRITSAPDSTVLRVSDFGLVIRGYTLYFFDPSYQYLVPDERWFADSGSAALVSGRVVAALLAGPAPWLASPVLVSAFPSGTQLGDPPTIDGNTVTVDLSAQAQAASDAQKQRMLQQLTWSLRSLAVTNATITVSGLPVTIPDGPVISPDIPVQYEAVGFDGKSFGALTSSGVSALPGIGAQIAALTPRGVTLSHDRSSAAVLGNGGVSLVGATPDPVVVDARAGLVAPSLDPDGYVWSAPGGDPSGLIVVRSDAKAHPVPLPLTGSIVSLAVSRDGTRLLVAIATGAGPRAVLFGIQRDKDGVPTGFGSSLDLPIGNAALIGASWLDGNSIAVLSGSANGLTDVDEYAISGLTTGRGSLRGGVGIAGGSDGIRVLDADGNVLQPSLAEDWQGTGLHASFLGIQQ